MKIYLRCTDYTCPSAIITNTWYWPLLCSTIVIAISIIGANEVGPADYNDNIQVLVRMPQLKQ